MKRAPSIFDYIDPLVYACLRADDLARQARNRREAREAFYRRREAREAFYRRHPEHDPKTQLPSEDQITVSAGKALRLYRRADAIRAAAAAIPTKEPDMPIIITTTERVENARAAILAGRDREAAEVLVGLVADVVQSCLGADSGDLAAYYLDGVEVPIAAYIAQERDRSR